MRRGRTRKEKTRSDGKAREGQDRDIDGEEDKCNEESREWIIRSPGKGVWMPCESDGGFEFLCGVDGTWRSQATRQRIAALDGDAFRTRDCTRKPRPPQSHAARL
eukprot:1169727-Pleurochrysis_carterae.AAC.1